MRRTLTLLVALMLLFSILPSGVLAEGAPRVLTIGSYEQQSEFWNYDVFKTVEKELNIKIEYTCYSGDSYNAMLAGGEMPDIVMGYKNLQQVLSNNLALDLNPYLEQYAPNMLSEYYGGYVELSRKMMGGEKQGFYIVMPVVGLHNYMSYGGITPRGYTVHWEYYKELGCPEINNDEDYINVLYQMWKNHPKTEDGSPTYMYGCLATNLAYLTYRSCFLKTVAVNQWCPYFFKNDILTNDLVNCYTNTERSNYWEDISMLNKIYLMGGLDPDLFTLTSDEYSAKRDKGIYMGTYMRSGNVMMTIPSSNEVQYTNLILALGNCPSYFSFVSARSKNVDIALGFFNYIYDIDFARTWYSGVQGKDWVYDENGVPSMTDEAIALKAAADPYWSNKGAGYGIREKYLSGYNPAVLGSDGYPLDLSFMRETAIAAQSEMELDFCKVYGVEHHYDAFINKGIQDFRNDAGEAISSCITEVPTDMQRILSACNDVLYTAAPSLIMASSDGEYAEIQQETLDELESLQLQKAWDWYSSEWEPLKEIFNDYLKDAIPAAGFELYEVE